MDLEVINYIREHRDTYTREAITARLLEAGHSQETIDAAWRQIVDPAQAAAPSEGAASAEPPILRQPHFWLALLGYVVGLLLLTNILNVINLLVGLVFYAGALLFGFLYPIIRFERSRAVALGFLCGLVVVIVLLVVSPGLCTVAIEGI
jgi:hypothetical protein